MTTLAFSYFTLFTLLNNISYVHVFLYTRNKKRKYHCILYVFMTELKLCKTIYNSIRVRDKILSASKISTDTCGENVMSSLILSKGARVC